MRIRGYAAGTMCWAEVTSPDIEASSEFYGALFGWAGDGRTFSLGDRAVAGIRPLLPDAPPTWLAHIATDDAAATAEAVCRAGGRVRVPVSQVSPPAPPAPAWSAWSASQAPSADAPLGRLAVVSDPGGAVFAVWQRGTFFGAQLQTEPGALCWTELATSDVDAAAKFYAAVFDWQALPAESAPGEMYYEWFNHADTVAGLVPLDHRFPQHVRPHWTVAFMVLDCQAACDRVISLGGQVARRPMSVAVGWYVRVADPHGAQFAVIELDPALRDALI